MAGSSSQFDAANFRSQIKNTMRMGFPESTDKQLTWRWTAERTYTKADSGGLPFVWAASEVTSTDSPTDLIVDCAVEFTASTNSTRVGGTGLGIMDIASVTVTVLDTDYDALLTHGDGRLPDQASIDGNIYVVQIVAPPIGLFDVTIYQLYLQAIDES